MHYFIIFFLLISHFQQSTSFSCLGCDRTDTTRCDNDPKSEDCKSGELVSDVCDCFKECARAEGETCGGFSRRCASNFYCHIHTVLEYQHHQQQHICPAPGFCKQRPKNACSTTEDCYKYPLSELLLFTCNMEDSGCVCKNGRCEEICK